MIPLCIFLCMVSYGVYLIVIFFCMVFAFWRYTTLPHDKLKTRLKEAIHKAFSHRNYGSNLFVLGYNSTYFSNKIKNKVKHATPRNKWSVCWSSSSITYLSQSFDGGYMRERSWFQVIQKNFRVFQNPHVIYTTTRVNSFTIFLLSLFYCRQNLCQVHRQFFRRTSWWSRYVPFFNIVFVCKLYYFECLINELGINTSSNTTYKPTSFDKDEILANHRWLLTQFLSLGIWETK
jgi:hypothetical protein